uniref:GDNF family receptor alpha like n=1 Tax=Podarcis muralis TaxID=64176 RepID=A0A670I3U2_PODMU
VKFLVDQFPEFKDCTCTNDNCSTTALLGKQCFGNKEYKHLRSCFQVKVDCVNDGVCNRQLSRYLQACQANATQCNWTRCQAALRSFYENMPLNVALVLTFCDCMPSDENCHQAKGFLHGTVCGVNMVPAPSCLSVIDTCQRNEICRAKYEAFTSKCLKPFARQCLEDTACFESLDANDLMCSDSDECRAAYVGMWGSVLRGVECTCDTTPLAKQTACKWFHHILHSKSCFTQISGGKADLYSSRMVLPGKILPVTGERSSLYSKFGFFKKNEKAPIKVIGEPQCYERHRLPQNKTKKAPIKGSRKGIKPNF